MKHLWLKYMGTISAIAMMVATFNANSACTWITHQEEAPEEITKLRKF